MSDLDLLAAALLGSLLGAGLGLMTGLVPGLHANNLAQGALAARGSFVGALGFLAAGAAAQGGPEGLFAACGFLVGLSLGHGFTDEIPAVFLGAPDPDTALSVLPGHRLLMAGLGRSAVRASAAGSALGVMLSLPLVPLLAAVMGPPLDLYRAAAPLVPVLLLAVAGALCLSERGRPEGGIGKWRARALAVAVLLLSAGLGELVVFHGLPLPVETPFGAPAAVGSSHMLSLFAGLFGLPTLLLAVIAAPPVPVASTANAEIRLPRRRTLRVAFLGTGAGAFVGWLPGVGAAQAAVLATFAREGAPWRRGPRETRRDSPEEAAEFLLVQSTIGSANMVFNLVALFSLLRVRSGTMAAVADLGAGELEAWSEPLRPPALLSALLVSVAAALPLCYAGALLLGQGCAGVYRRLPPRLLAACVFAGLTALIAALEGSVGLGVALTALLLGLVPPLAGIKRVHLMGAILVPVALRMAAGAH